MKTDLTGRGNIHIDLEIVLNYEVFVVNLKTIINCEGNSIALNIL